MSNIYYNFREFEIEIIPSPKVNISQPSVEPLVSECTELTRASFGSQDISRDLVSRHLFETSITVLGRNNSGKIIGFGSSKTINVEEFHIIFLQCIVISNDYKNKGLHKFFLLPRLVEAVKKIKAESKNFDENHILIGGRTQSPVAYRAVNELLGLFPNPGGFIDNKLRSVGRKYAKSLYNDDCEFSNHAYEFNFNEKTFVAKETYKSKPPAGQTEEREHHSNIHFCHDQVVDNYMKNILDWDNGDALILLGYYNCEKVRTFLDNTQQLMSECLVSNPVRDRLAG